MQFLALLTVLVSGALAIVTAEDQPAKANSEQLVDQVDDVDDQSLDREAKLFAFRTSTSRTLLASTTVLALSTCIVSVNTVACTGRKKRNVLKDALLPFKESLHGADLSSSVASNDDDELINYGDNREPKKVLTVWTTGFTTLTVTTTSYYQGITVSVSLACNPGSATNSCFG